MKYFTLLYIILLASVNTISAQNVISGIVTDQQNTPLQGVHVFLPEISSLMII